MGLSTPHCHTFLVLSNGQGYNAASMAWFQQPFDIFYKSSGPRGGGGGGGGGWGTLALWVHVQRSFHTP